MKDVTIISKNIPANPRSKNYAVGSRIIAGGGSSVDVSGKLDKSVWAGNFEELTDPNGIDYLFLSKPLVLAAGFTMYAGNPATVPPIFDKLPIDDTLAWINGKLSVVGGGGGSTDIQYLSDLLDTNTVSAIPSDLLMYDGTYWKNVPKSTIGIYNLRDLLDTNTLNAVADDVLMFNGSKWVNVPKSTIGGGSGSINGIVTKDALSSFTYTPESDGYINLPLYDKNVNEKIGLVYTDIDGGVDIGMKLDFHNGTETGSYAVRMLAYDDSYFRVYAPLGMAVMDGYLACNDTIIGGKGTADMNAAAFTFWTSGIDGKSSGIGAHSGADNIIYLGACDNITGSWLDDYKQTWQFNGCIKAQNLYCSVGDKQIGGLGKMYSSNDYLSLSSTAGGAGLYINTLGGVIRFGTQGTSNADSYQMQLDPAGCLQVASGIGVGIYPQSYKLHVNGTSRFVGKIKADINTSIADSWANSLLITNATINAGDYYVNLGTTRPILSWMDTLSGYGWITRYSIGSYRNWNNSGWGSLCINVGSNDSGTTGYQARFCGDGWLSSDFNILVNNGELKMFWDENVRGGIGNYANGDFTLASFVNDRDLRIYATNGEIDFMTHANDINNVAGKFTRSNELWVTGAVRPNTSSDRRLKENFTRPDYCQRILDMGFVYDFNYNAIAKARTIRLHDDLTHTSPIYQNVINVMPEMCREDNDGYGAINPIHTDFQFTMMGAIQMIILDTRDNKSEIDRLKARVKQLENERSAA